MRLKDLTLEELEGVINIYPWFSLAKMELCRRMADEGSLSDEQCSELSLYLASRADLKKFMRRSSADCSDAAVSELVKAYTSSRPARAVGGDYFSQAEYDNVRKDSDNAFSFVAKRSASEQSASQAEDLGMYTETLAQIYAEQGYSEQAKSIYDKLILFYPDRKEYFEKQISILSR